MNDVDALIDDLIAAHDPKTTDIVTFRGAQYDRGLAWVHFPEGYGGLELPPTHQRAVDTRLRVAGAPPYESKHFFGLTMAGPTVVTAGRPMRCAVLMTPEMISAAPAIGSRRRSIGRAPA